MSPVSSHLSSASSSLFLNLIKFWEQSDYSGFRFQYPRLKFLSRCLETKREHMSRSPPLRLTHVKPRHVTHSPRQPASTFSAKVRLVREFMANLKAAGFDALIMHRRHNTLAMLISDFELKFKRKSKLYEEFEEKFIDIVNILQYNYLILEIGYQEAVIQNISTIETNFTAVTAADSCQEYIKIFRVLNKNGFEIPPRLANTCAKVRAWQIYVFWYCIHSILLHWYVLLQHAARFKIRVCLMIFVAGGLPCQCSEAPATQFVGDPSRQHYCCEDPSRLAQHALRLDAGPVRHGLAHHGGAARREQSSRRGGTKHHRHDQSVPRHSTVPTWYSRCFHERAGVCIASRQLGLRV